MVISGFSDKLPLFAERVCRAVRQFSPDQPTFARVSELLRRDYLAWDTQQPYSHCAYFAGLASETLQFPIEALRAALQSTGWASQRDFVQRLLRGGSQGTALIVGNIDPAGARQLLSIGTVSACLVRVSLSHSSSSCAVDRAFPFEPLPLPQRALKRVLRYPASPQGQLGTRISRTEPNGRDANSATTFYFQLASTDPAQYMSLELLAELVEQPFYNSLRTQQQLGYIVFSGVKVREGGTRYLTFTVQSRSPSASPLCVLLPLLTLAYSVADGPRLTSLVERFLEQELPELLTRLDERGLQTFKVGR